MPIKQVAKMGMAMNARDLSLSCDTSWARQTPRVVDPPLPQEGGEHLPALSDAVWHDVHSLSEGPVHEPQAEWHGRHVADEGSK